MIVKINSKAHNEKVQTELKNKGYNVHTALFRDGSLYCYTYNGFEFIHPYEPPKPHEITDLFNDEFELNLELKKYIINHKANVLDS